MTKIWVHSSIGLATVFNKRSIGISLKSVFPAIFIFIVAPLPSDAAVYEAIGDDGVAVFSSQPYEGLSNLLFVDDVASRGREIERHTPSSFNVHLQHRRTSIGPVLDAIAARHQVEPALVRSIAHVESRFNTSARSPKGANGVMQVMPLTGVQYGVTDHRSVTQNIEAGVRYIKALLARFNGNVPLALAAYNAGEGSVLRAGHKVPPFRETMLYVPEVLMRYEEYRRQDAQQAR